MQLEREMYPLQYFFVFFIQQHKINASVINNIFDIPD